MGSLDLSPCKRTGSSRVGCIRLDSAEEILRVEECDSSAEIREQEMAMTTACRDGNRCPRGGMVMISLLAVLLLAALVIGASAYAYPRTLVAVPLAEGMPPSQGFRGAARVLGELA